MCLGIPGRIVSVDNGEDCLATVDVCGVKRQINVSCIIDDDHPVDSCVGEWVLIHVGFAMSRIDDDEAVKTLQILTELGEAQAEVEAMRGSPLQ
ncbi:MAG TPA: HypC/HybG/HupF family hydrogenase formation chaperone [Methylocystis sp.]|jgi:hydrogenase expression/formation protein HypC